MGVQKYVAEQYCMDSSRELYYAFNWPHALFASAIERCNEKHEFKLQVSNNGQWTTNSDGS